MPPWTLSRSRLASAVRSGKDPEVIAELRSTFTTERLEDQIRQVRAGLNNAQRAHLARVLLADDDSAAAG